MTATDTADAAERAERVEQEGPIRRGFMVWYAVFGGVAAWTVHLVFEASYVQYSCNRGNQQWPMHLVTVLTAAATIVAILLSIRLIRIGRDRPQEEPSPGGRLHYLGFAGLLVGVINLALILLEGSYVLVLNSCVR